VLTTFWGLGDMPKVLMKFVARREEQEKKREVSHVVRRGMGM